MACTLHLPHSLQHGRCSHILVPGWYPIIRSGFVVVPLTCMVSAPLRSVAVVSVPRHFVQLFPSAVLGRITPPMLASRLQFQLFWGRSSARHCPSSGVPFPVPVSWLIIALSSPPAVAPPGLQFPGLSFPAFGLFFLLPGHDGYRLCTRTARHSPGPRTFSVGFCRAALSPGPSGDTPPAILVVLPVPSRASAIHAVRRSKRIRR